MKHILEVVEKAIAENEAKIKNIDYEVAELSYRKDALYCAIKELHYERDELTRDLKSVNGCSLSPGSSISGQPWNGETPIGKNYATLEPVKQSEYSALDKVTALVDVYAKLAASGNHLSTLSPIKSLIDNALTQI